MKKNNQTKNIFLAIIAVIFIGALVGGGTYAYWTWQTNTSQQTAVTFTISKPNFTIVGDNISSNTLAPTQSCYYQSASSGHVQHTMAGRATVTAQNNTSASMKATITLKGALKPVSGRTLPTSGSNSAANIHWAIKEVASATTGFSASNCTGTTGLTYATGTFKGIAPNSATLTYRDIATTITFDVAPGTTATKYYQVYVWIDSAYTHTNYGSTNDDPMQGLTVALTFSENSIFTQDLLQYVYNTSTNVAARIGQPIPDGMVPYLTPALAMANFENRPFYLKYKMNNGIIEESYVEFIVTPEMASAHGMTAGTYTLKGGDGGASFDVNKWELMSAFGSNYCVDSGGYFQCEVSGLLGEAAQFGNVIVRAGDRSSCEIDSNYSSGCQPPHP